MLEGELVLGGKQEERSLSLTLTKTDFDRSYNSQWISWELLFTYRFVSYSGRCLIAAVLSSASNGQLSLIARKHTLLVMFEKDRTGLISALATTNISCASKVDVLLLLLRIYSSLFDVFVFLHWW